jgi:type II secretory pathway pseudopilin PulG
MQALMRSCRKTPKRRFFRRPVGNRGISLVDLLIVMMILAILGLAVIPQLHFDDLKLNAAATEVVSAAGYARTLAIRYQRPFGLAADAGGNRIKVFDLRFRFDPAPHPESDPPVDANGVVIHPIDKKWYLKDFDEIVQYQGTTISSAPPVNGEVYFFGNGNISYQNDVNIALSYGSGQRTITIDAINGRVTVD